MRSREASNGSKGVNPAGEKAKSGRQQQTGKPKQMKSVQKNRRGHNCGSGYGRASCQTPGIPKTDPSAGEEGNNGDGKTATSCQTCPESQQAKRQKHKSGGGEQRFSSIPPRRNLVGRQRNGLPIWIGKRQRAEPRLQEDFFARQYQLKVRRHIAGRFGIRAHCQGEKPILFAEDKVRRQRMQTPRPDG